MDRNHTAFIRWGKLTAWYSQFGNRSWSGCAGRSSDSRRACSTCRDWGSAWRHCSVGLVGAASAGCIVLHKVRSCIASRSVLRAVGESLARVRRSEGVTLLHREPLPTRWDLVSWSLGVAFGLRTLALRRIAAFLCCDVGQCEVLASPLLITTYRTWLAERLDSCCRVLAILRPIR